MTSLVLLTVVSLANLHKRPEALARYYVTSYWQAEWVKKLRRKTIELPPPPPLVVKLTFLLKTNMEVDSEGATLQSLLNTEAETSQSLLNTEYDQLIGGEDANSSDSEDYGLTSYPNNPHHKYH